MIPVQIFLLLLIPALVWWRWPKTPFALFAAVAGVFAGFALLYATVLSSGVALSQANEDGNYQVTYYEFSRFNFFLGAALVFTALALTIWAQGRWFSHPLPKTLPFLFWSFHLAWTFKSYGLMLFVKTPRRYIDYPDYVDRLFAITRFCNLTMAFALFCLFALLLWALARKLWAVTAR